MITTEEKMNETLLILNKIWNFFICLEGKVKQKNFTKNNIKQHKNAKSMFTNSKKNSIIVLWIKMFN